MGLFKDMLQSGESLFKNELALDFSFLPKLLPYRESEQHYMATCIKPLLENRNGRNLFIHGPPGIGKTAAIRFVLRDMEDESDDVTPIYINCWQKNSTFKVYLEICDAVGYKLTHNKRGDELFNIIKQIINKKAAVFVFDEIDKVEDLDFLYSILEEIYKKSIVLITNHAEWLLELDGRIKSRLVPDRLEFRQYNAEETKGILKDRMGYAFVPGVWDNEGFEVVVKQTVDLKDIRTGLFLMREAGFIAEAKSSKKITLNHVKDAIEKLNKYSTKKKDDLEIDQKLILKVIKKNSGKRIGNIFKIYQEHGGKSAYRTFQRKINKLIDNSFISAKRITGGQEGTTRILSYCSIKKLTEFQKEEDFKDASEL